MPQNYREPYQSEQPLSAFAQPLSATSQPSGHRDVVLVGHAGHVFRPGTVTYNTENAPLSLARATMAQKRAHVGTLLLWLNPTDGLRLAAVLA